MKKLLIALLAITAHTTFINNVHADEDKRVNIYTQNTRSMFPNSVKNFVNNYYSIPHGTDVRFRCNPYAKYVVDTESTDPLQSNPEITAYTAKLRVYGESDKKMTAMLGNKDEHGRPYREREFTVLKLANGKLVMHYMSCEDGGWQKK